MLNVRTVSAISMLAFVASCASIMTGKHDVLNVNSSPSGAKFTTNTGTQGVTPAKVEVPDSVDVTFNFEKEGYQPQSFVANHRLSGWVWGNILIGGIIGFIIDVASGGMNTHDLDVNVTLAPFVPHP